MIRAVIFDMDGVLIDARDWHFEALNESLSVFGLEISIESHIAEFDGLPTKVKLKKLAERKLLPERLIPLINEVKQERTLRVVANKCFPNPSHVAMLSYLKSEGYKLGLATNSVRASAEMMLKYAGIYSFFDSVFTNEDVQKPKPNPEIYLKSALANGVPVEECLVVEDNPNGFAAASSAGCKLLKVKDPDDVHLDKILKTLETL